MPLRSGRPITLEDVATEANVSRSTVSLVLRDSPLVAADTRKRVLASAKKLGYVPDRRAASLRSRRSHMFGMIVPNVLSPVYGGMIDGVEHEFGVSNTLLALSNSKDDLTRQSDALTQFVSHGVDGVILVAAVGTTAENLSRPLQMIGRKCVLVGRDVPGSDLDYAGPDNIRGAEMATEHLFERGHKVVAFVGGQGQSTTQRDRVAGFRKAHEQKGVCCDDDLSVASPVTHKGGYEAITELLSRRRDVTALVCYNAAVAFGVLSGISRAGMTPGKDVAVVTFDHVEQAELWDPPITTVGVDPIQLGVRAARLLVQRSNEPTGPRESVVLLPELRIRESSSQ